MSDEYQNVPKPVPNSFRVTLEVNSGNQRLDSLLLQYLREQDENLNLKNISRTHYKELFKNGKIVIKGQAAKTSSTLARGITYVDVILK